MTRKPTMLASLPFLAIGIVFIMHGAWRMHLADASMGWPNVKGTIVSSDVTEGTALDGASKYYPHITFRYVVDGLTYESDQYTFGQRSSMNELYAQGLVDGFARNSEATVYYNPDRPEQAVLQVGDSTGLRIRIGTGAALLVIGALVWGRSWVRRAPF
ncbi:MAG: DUF3592 domain-containing protein [Lentisphaerae bacterium]|nr:DUF3592 domain-containing protein [Lentisphaerota bacterium]